MAKIDTLLKEAMDRRASDLHLSSGAVPEIRIDGDLVESQSPFLTSDDVQELVFELLSPEEQEKFLKNQNLDKSYLIEGLGAFRVNFFVTLRGISAVFRTIPIRIPTIEELSLPPHISDLAELSNGLVLVTGPTGSGKSTTLAALINYINQRFPYHIVTIEDPIEFVHQNKASLVNQREIGSHCHSFADALKYVLREDPDVILVGEMRDLETMALAMTAAETGHLVFGTLHTRGAAASIDRIIDSFPANQQAMIRAMLSESLAGVISQVLLKRIDKPGRIAATEIMVVNHAISNLIREGKTFQIRSTMQTSRREGMVLLDQSLSDLVKNHIISPMEAAYYMQDPSALGITSSTTHVPSVKTMTAKDSGKATPPKITPKIPPTVSKAPPPVSSQNSQLRSSNPPPQAVPRTPTPKNSTPVPAATRPPLKPQAAIPQTSTPKVQPLPPAPTPKKAVPSTKLFEPPKKVETILSPSTPIPKSPKPPTSKQQQTRTPQKESDDHSDISADDSIDMKILKEEPSATEDDLPTLHESMSTLDDEETNTPDAENTEPKLENNPVKKKAG